MSRTTPFLALFLGGLLAGGTAWASSWSDYSTAFPLFPCQDGWMACIVDGKAVTPDLVRSSSGQPQPANLRVSWDDLEPTAAFSPFSTLSEYTGEAPAVAEAEPEPEPEPEVVADAGGREDDGGGRRTPRGDGGGSEDGGGSGSGSASSSSGSSGSTTSSGTASSTTTASSTGTAAAAPTTTASSGRTDTPTTTTTAAATPTTTTTTGSSVRPKDGGTTTTPATTTTAAATPATTTTTTTTSSSVRPKDGGTTTATTTSTQASATTSGTATRTDGGGTASTTTAAAVKPPVAVVAAVPQDDSCDNLTKLEPQAMLGKLSDGQTACLEAAYAATSKQTDKDKLSRVLMANAYSKGDTKTWEKLIKRHLEEVDQSDPDLCYKYALHLSKGGAARANGVIRWANVALENRTVWTGETYQNRVSGLYKLRAAAAQSLWKAAEDEHAKAPTDATKKKVEETRNSTKVFAREWYEYTKAAGKDTTTALQLCVSAAGTKDYCEGA